MTLDERVRRAQRWSAAAVALAALLWAAALAMAVIVLVALVNLVHPLALGLRAAIVPLSAVAALAGASRVLWRGRAAWSVPRLALWIEEQESQGYALVTAIDPATPAAWRDVLQAQAGRVDLEQIVHRAIGRMLERAGAACLLSSVALTIVAPRNLLHSAVTAFTERAAPRPAAPMTNRLVTLRARVAPPAYSRLPDRTIDEPKNVAALIGSRVTFVGQGVADGVGAFTGAEHGAAVTDDHGWSIAMTMPKEPVVVELRDRNYRRLVALEPIVDSAPVVKLRLPARDTTYQTVPTGTLEIAADLTDDVGLATGSVEYMLSTGSEESFQTKQYAGRPQAYDNARQATLRTTIALDTMGLKPGSVLHIRVVAFDYNDVTGPGKGVSETRTLRVAEPVDSTSINAAPPLPIDSMWISQRLLNMRTDTLIRRKRTLQREVFTHTSSAYSNTQEDIRRRALAVIALLEDNGVGGSFETETSGKLRTAIDLMWTAREHLGIALPDSAMPYMKKILAILDELRLAHRYYLRGLLRPVPVNVERARLTGKDSAAASARAARAVLADVNSALASRIEAAQALARTAPQAAADSLTFIRVSALTSAPAAAGALQDAIDRLRRGAVADSALARARRALAPRSRLMAGGALPWNGAVP